jgi:hypothetical protein
MKNTENTSSFLYLLCYDVKYFEKIYGVIGNYLSVIDDTYSVYIMEKKLKTAALAFVTSAMLKSVPKLRMDAYQESIKLNQEKKRAS